MCRPGCVNTVKGLARHRIAHGWEGSLQPVLLLRPPFYSTIPVIWASWAGSGQQHGIRRGLACHGLGLGTVGRDIQILASVPRLVLSIPVDLDDHGGGCLSGCTSSSICPGKKRRHTTTTLFCHRFPPVCAFLVSLINLLILSSSPSVASPSQMPHPYGPNPTHSPVLLSIHKLLLSPKPALGVFAISILRSGLAFADCLLFACSLTSLLVHSVRNNGSANDFCKSHQSHC